MSQLLQSDLEAHAKAFSLDVLVVDALLLELAIEGELTDSATNSTDDLANAIAGTCQNGPEERHCSSSVSTCLEFADKLGWIAEDVES